MRSTESSPARQQISTRVLLFAAIASALWYAKFLLFSDAGGDLLPYTLLLIAEAVGMSQFGGLWATVLLGGAYRETKEMQELKQMLINADPKRIPCDLVTIFVPTAGEPLEIIRATVIAAREVRVPHRTVVLDDGHSDELREVTQSLDVEYLRREDRDGRKAGNVNHGLQHVQSQFFAIVDCDHIPKPSFLEDTLPWLLSDDRISFVQTPQYFRNREGFVSGGSAEAQEIFYKHVQAAKNAFDAVFCVGTNVVFRRSMIDEIGGIYEKSNSEDIWTSLLLHEKGYGSVFVPTVLAEGLAPETLGDFFKQQFRWARGGFEIFFKRNVFRANLSLDQKLQYLFTTSHYLSGVAVLCYASLPLLYAYFGLRPFSYDAAGQWIGHAFPYFVMLALSTIHLLGRIPLWRSIVISISAFPAHLAALLSVLTGMKAKWSVTGVIKSRTDYVTSVAPHLLIFIFSLGAIPKVLLSDAPIPERAWMALWLVILASVMLSISRRAFPRAAQKDVAILEPSYA